MSQDITWLKLKLQESNTERSEQQDDLVTIIDAAIKRVSSINQVELDRLKNMVHSNETVATRVLEKTVHNLRGNYLELHGLLKEQEDQTESI